MRHAALIFGLCFVLAACGTTSGQNGEDKGDEGNELRPLRWMSGTWVQEEGAVRTEEKWTVPAENKMFGIERVTKGGEPAFFELLRIKKLEQGIVLFISPNGKEPTTRLTLTSMEDERAVFENPAHDFPARISYWREGDVLHARAEGSKGGSPHKEELTMTLVEEAPEPDPEAARQRRIRGIGGDGWETGTE